MLARLHSGYSLNAVEVPSEVIPAFINKPIQSISEVFWIGDNLPPTQLYLPPLRLTQEVLDLLDKLGRLLNFRHMPALVERDQLRTRNLLVIKLGNAQRNYRILLAP